MRLSLSRREFLTTAAGVGGSMLLQSMAHALPVDQRFLQAMSAAIGVDMHNHVYPAGTEPHPQGLPEAGNSRPPGASKDQPRVLLLADEIKRSGFTAVCASFVLDFASAGMPTDPHDIFLRWLAAVDSELEKGHIRRALNLKDLQAAHDHGQPAIVQSVEGAQFIEGHLDRVGEAYQRGLRHLQLLHERDDRPSPLGDVVTTPAHLGGLTAFGAEVVRECNRLGILVDLAHASHETVLAAVKVAKEPFIVSHTSLDSRAGMNPKMAEMMKPRLISKEHAKVVADAGGVIGVWTHLADSLRDYVESIHAMVEAVGVDHVGIGSDTDLLSAHLGQGTNVAWPGLSGGFFNAVVSEMLAQSFTVDDIRKVGGGNFCRVFDEATYGN